MSKTKEGGVAPAVKLAHQLREPDGTGIVRLSTGYYARIMPVSAALIDSVQAEIKDPEPPLVWIEVKSREERNPSDPTYLRELKNKETERALAAMDAMLMFGVELVDPETGEPDPYPEDDGWIKRLKLLSRRRDMHLEDYDLEDPIDKEFLFKKYVAVAAPDFILMSAASGISAEAIQDAEDTFRSNAARDTDT